MFEFFVAVIFFCTPAGDCAFYVQNAKVFDTQRACVAHIDSMKRDLAELGPVKVASVCAAMKVQRS